MRRLDDFLRRRLFGAFGGFGGFRRFFAFGRRGRRRLFIRRGRFRDLLVDRRQFCRCGGRRRFVRRGRSRRCGGDVLDGGSFLFAQQLGQPLRRGVHQLLRLREFAFDVVGRDFDAFVLVAENQRGVAGGAKKDQQQDQPGEELSDQTASLAGGRCGLCAGCRGRRRGGV